MLAILEFASDEPSVPCQNGVWLGDGRHFAQGLAAQSKANLTECRSLGVREPQAPVYEFENELGATPGGPGSNLDVAVASSRGPTISMYRFYSLTRSLYSVRRFA